MRIRRLDLLAYGHFTDVGFDLPASQPDIHFVFGPNEAGKSTMLCAIEDLLFGIPHNTRHGFLHDYGSMLVGAVIEGINGALEFRRRKGTKDTLLNKDGLPLATGEAALAPFLNGAERPFFARMFCLDNERLREGGKEILKAQDDVGQILFSAGSGIAGLRERLKKMNEDADALWGSRHSSRRKYSRAEDRFKAAEDAIREHTVTATQWQELRTALDNANEACQLLEAEIEDKTVEVRRLSRIRRVFRDVAKHAEVTKRIGELGEVVSLPEDFGRLLEEALDADAHAQTRLDLLKERIEELRGERSALHYDEVLLARSEHINELHERRIQVRGGKADLPKRQAELAAGEASLKALAAELEWQRDDSSQIVSHLPARPKLINARALAKKRGEFVAAEANSRVASEEADERVDELARKIEQGGTLIDVSGLAATTKTVREAGDISARLAVAKKEVKAATDAIEGFAHAMRPAVADSADLISMPVPHKHTVEHHRDRTRELVQRLQTCRDQIRNTEALLKRHRKEYERIANDEHAVPTAELQRLRDRRDTGWSILRRKYVEGAFVSDTDVEAFEAGAPLPDAYEAAVRDSDAAADQRFERAHATARLAEIARQIAEQEEHLEELRAQELGYCDDAAALAAEWQALWKNVSLTLLPPDEMLSWIDARSQILQAIEKKALAEQEFASLRDEELGAKTLLIKELGTLGIASGSLEPCPLRVVLQLAADTQRQHENKAATVRKLEEDLENATVESARKRKRLQEAEAAFANWRNQWAEAITLIALNPNATTETLDAQIDMIDQMRELANQMNDLRRDRIEKIERDIAAFETEVVELVMAMAPQLKDRSPEDAALELERLLQESTRAHELARVADSAISAEKKKLEECEQVQREAKMAIERLQKAAAAASLDDLREAIRRSNELRTLRAECDEVLSALAKDGDGISVADLAAECAAVDLDQIAAREETVNRELSDLRTRLMEASERRSGARREIDAVGGDNRAARAAADRQAALSEMKEIAEEYIRLRSAVLLLQGAIDRYRREKQGPLLKRAGELFAILTGGSFEGLQLEFDEDDNAQIAGVRRNGRKLVSSEMSTGAADQLYLALRVAAIEDFLGHSAPLPFIADDLFVHFDDQRAAAGFKVLAQLAQMAQVLFFTHHKHLIDLAKETLGASISIIILSPQVVPLDTAQREPRAADFSGRAATG